MALRRLIELRLPISLITDDADISAARLTDAEWNSLGAICDVLRPIETCNSRWPKVYNPIDGFTSARYCSSGAKRSCAE